VGNIQLDQMAPEATLVALPTGAHLVLLWSAEQAQAAHKALSRLLDKS
jgi:hypothetical protein